MKIKVTIWNEHPKEQQNWSVKKAYPNGMSESIAEIFDSEEFDVKIRSQNMPDDGLDNETLKETDVLLYWAHELHEKIFDETVERLASRVREGMTIILLHSAHFSKIFKKLLGTSGSLKWREDGRHERVYNIFPTHPIANGIGEHFLIEKEEMYGEYFDIPSTVEVVFMGWYPKGEIFRSGFTYNYGKGKIFYFQPGHETFPVYKNDSVKKILKNATYWGANREIKQEKTFVKSVCDFQRPLEKSFGKPKE